MAFGDILWANLPPPDGHVQAGTRPSILVQADDDEQLATRTVVPVSGNLKTERFPATVRVDPSEANGLKTPSVLLGFAITSLAKERVGGKIGALDPDDQARLKTALRAFLGL